MSYYKLDYYDVSLEILAVYLQVRLASLFAQRYCSASTELTPNLVLACVPNPGFP